MNISLAQGNSPNCFNESSNYHGITPHGTRFPSDFSCSYLKHSFFVIVFLCAFFPLSVIGKQQPASPQGELSSPALLASLPPDTSRLNSELLSRPLYADWQEVVLGIEHAPPYVISTQNSGLEVDIIRAALRAVGYKLRVEYMPTGRGVRLLLNKRVDLVAPIYHDDKGRFYLSDTHIYHRPSLFSLTTNGIQITEIDDISRGSVAAYQGVLTGFGARFQHIARQCPLFVELGDAKRIVDMLFKERVDVAILDLFTFQYFLKANELDSSVLNIHDFIEPVPAGVAFHDNIMKRKFEKGVRIILGNGEYERIAGNYLDKNSVTQLIRKLEMTLTKR